MKVYTKTGDKGTTMLLGGERVPKHHIKIEAYGEIDELNSYIGLVLDSAVENSQSELLEQIQNQLFTIGSYLSLVVGNEKVKLPELKEEWIINLELAMDKMDEELEPLKNFVLPGGHLSASYCHVARCHCRKAERRATQLAEVEEVNPLILRYLNRLSDYLFMLSRYWILKSDSKERLWLP